MFIRHLPALGAAALLTALPALAQDHSAQQQAQAKFLEGASVAIEGCVTAGQEPDTFVMGSVREIPAQPIETGLRRFYWFEAKHLRGHAGHKVQLAGRIDKIEPRELEVKRDDDAPGGVIVEIDGPGPNVKTDPATIGVGTSGRADIPMTLIRLNIDKVTVVEGACG